MGTADCSEPRSSSRVHQIQGADGCSDQCLSSCGRTSHGSTACIQQQASERLACNGFSSGSQAGAGQNHTGQEQRRLRILCLHGFRQSASSFRGRSAALAKRLSGIADLVFMDAPHILPHFVKASDVCSCDRDAGSDSSTDYGRGNCQNDAGRQAIARQRPRRAWLLEPAQLAALKVHFFSTRQLYILTVHMHYTFP